MAPTPLRAARLALAAAAAMLLASVPASALDVPYLVGRVNDYAEMVPRDVADRLEEKLRALEERTGAQVAVLTVESLEGEPIEDFSMRVAETWKLGQKDKDNGVLFVVAEGDRKMRIEVGYGLEPVLTDALCKRILDGITRTRFRAGDFGGGIEASVDAIAGVIEGNEGAVPAEAASGGTSMSEMPLGARVAGMFLFVVVIGVFSTIAVFAKGCQSWFFYVFLMPFYLAFPVAFLGVAGMVLFVAWVLGFPFLKFFFAKTAAGKSFIKAHPALTTFATSSGRGGSGGGWSSGGSSFSGGGGSFGGGGSSSSW